MGIEIRRMQEEDRAAAMAVLAHWGMAPVAESKETPDPERSELTLGSTLVAVDAGRVVGVAGYIVHSDTLAETASLAVLPECRGQGVGRQLQLARLAELKAIGIRHVRTETDRPETIAWYIENFGYRITGKNPKKHTFSLARVNEWTVLELDI